MITYQEAKTAALSALERVWLRVLLAHYERRAANDTRLLARVRDEYERGIAPYSELQEWTTHRIEAIDQANAIRARLGMMV